MKYVICHGAIYELSEDECRRMLKDFANGQEVFLADFGKQISVRPLSESLIDLTNMSRHEAQSIIGGE